MTEGQTGKVYPVSDSIQEAITKALEIKTICRWHNPPKPIADTEKDIKWINEKASEILKLLCGVEAINENTTKQVQGRR